MWSSAYPQDTHMGDFSRQCWGQMDSRPGRGWGREQVWSQQRQDVEDPVGALRDFPVARGRNSLPRSPALTWPKGNDAMEEVKDLGPGGSSGWNAGPLPFLFAWPAGLLVHVLFILLLLFNQRALTVVPASAGPDENIQRKGCLRFLRNLLHV